jgi:hypothetical protein
MRLLHWHHPLSLPPDSAWRKLPARAHRSRRRRCAHVQQWQGILTEHNLRSANLSRQRERCRRVGRPAISTAPFPGSLSTITNPSAFDGPTAAASAICSVIPTCVEPPAGVAIVTAAVYVPIARLVGSMVTAREDGPGNSTPFEVTLPGTVPTVGETESQVAEPGAVIQDPEWSSVPFAAAGRLDRNHSTVLSSC